MSQADLPQVSLQRYVDLVKRRRWQLLPISLLGLLVGGLVALLIPRLYVAETLLVHQAIPGEEQRGEDPFLTIANSARLSIPLSARKAAEQLKWEETLVADPHQRTQFDKDLASRIFVQDSNPEQKRQFALIRVFYRDRDGKRAASFLNTLVAVWIKSRVEDLRKPVEERRSQAKTEFDNWTRTVDTLRENKRTIEQRHQIDPTIDLPARRQASVARQLVAREQAQALEQLEGALLALERQVAEMAERLAAMPARVPPAVEQLAEQAKGNPLAAALFLQIEVKRQEVESTWVPGTKEHKRQKATLEQWEKRLREMLSPSELGGDGLVPNPEHELLAAELAKKTLERDVTKKQVEARRLAVEAERQRIDDLVVAWQAYEVKIEELAEAEVARKAARTELDRAEELLNKLDSKPPVTVPDGAAATVPPRPTDPSIWLVSLIGCVLGLGAAIGLILLLDVLQGTFKTVEDVERALSVPVLGGMSHLETEEERRDLQRVRKRNSLIVLALLMLGGTVLLIYLVNPSALPSFVRDVLSFLLGRG